MVRGSSADGTGPAAELKEKPELDRQTVARQSLVFANMSDAVIITDLDGRITDWNPAATRVFGYQREEMLGRGVGRLYVLQDPHAVESEVIAEMARSDRWSGKLHFVRKNGSSGTCETVVVPLRNQAGERIATVGVNRDITERTRIEAELARSHAILAAIAEGTDDAIFVKDLQGRYVMINRAGARLLGKSVIEVIGKQDTELFPPDEAEAIEQIDRRVIDSGVCSTIEETISFSASPTRLLTSKAPWRDAMRNVIGVIGIARDVTERWRAQELAQQRQTELAHVLRLKTMGEMAAGLAHELNQPLAAVTNYARGCIRRLNDRTITTEDLLRVMEEVSAQAMRAGNIIRRLHALVRRHPSRQEHFEVNELIRGAVELVDAPLRHAGITLELRLGPALYVDGDPIQIEQVVLNLVKNASEAMPDGGSLFIESAPSHDNTVEISVSDTGPGVTDQELGTIFDPFITTKSTGLGMGLAISRSIAEAHRGRLYGGNRPNGGAIFRLLLPRVVEPGHPADSRT